MEALFGVVVIGLFLLIGRMAYRDFFFVDGVSVVEILWGLLLVAAAGAGLHRPVKRGIWPLVANHSFGSRIDCEHRELVWWLGSGKLKEHRTAIDGIAVVERIQDTETDDLTLYDGEGRKISFDTRCIADMTRWAEAFTRIFPAIRLEAR